MLTQVIGLIIVVVKDFITQIIRWYERPPHKRSSANIFTIEVTAGGTSYWKAKSKAETKGII